MNPSDYKQFTEEWKAAHEVMPGGKVLSVKAMDMTIEALNEFPIQHVIGAIKKHIKTGRFAPTPADIIEIIADHTRTKHIGPDEAWTIALAAMDEFETVIWTKEIAEAKAIAQGIYDEGDKVAARMAFKSAYERIIKTASRPAWYVTEGFDAQRRIEAVRQGVDRGLLPREALQKYIEAPVTTFAQLTSMAEKRNKPDVVSNLKRLKQAIAGSDKKEASAQEREQQRQAFEAHRERELSRVREMMRSETTA